ncbi:hypothetical protein WMF28_25800 [Sorangium sp. So ce590]|uniref:hypothetical protein n=1 Tax=Sorangium sp. So ce590 TaxID=3133317 RepID=UPI003F5EFD8E
MSPAPRRAPPRDRPPRRSVDLAVTVADELPAGTRPLARSSVGLTTAPLVKLHANM